VGTGAKPGMCHSCQGPFLDAGAPGVPPLKADSLSPEDLGALGLGEVRRPPEQFGAERLAAFGSAATGEGFEPGEATWASWRSPCRSSRISSMPSTAAAQQELRPPLIPS